MVLQIYAMIVALDGIFDRNYYDCPEWLELVLAAISVWYLVRPASLKRFIVVCISQAAVAIYTMPAIGNHILFSAIVNLYLVTEWSWRWLVTRQVPTFGSDLDSRISANLRRFMLSVYFFSTFHKLNTSYFNPAVSCAGDMVNLSIKSTLPFLPRLTHPVLISGFIYISIFLEGVAPALLLTRRFAMVGFALLTVLHLFLGTVVLDFNFLSFGYLLLFLPADCVVGSYRRLETFIRARPKPLLWAGVLLFFVLALNYKFYFHNPYIAAAIKIAMSDALVLLLAAGLAPFVYAALTQKDWPAKLDFKIYPLAIPFLLLWILNCLGPYLGIKDITSAAMYSNLRTEGRSNHFLIPKGLIQLSPEIDNLVQLDNSWLPYLHYQKVGFTLPYRPGQPILLPEFELGRIAALGSGNLMAPPQFNAFLREPRVEKMRDEYLAASWVKKKLFGFRAFYENPDTFCSW